MVGHWVEKGENFHWIAVLRVRTEGCGERTTLGTGDRAGATALLAMVTGRGRRDDHVGAFGGALGLWGVFLVGL